MLQRRIARRIGVLDVKYPRFQIVISPGFAATSHWLCSSTRCSGRMHLHQAGRMTRVLNPAACRNEIQLDSSSLEWVSISHRMAERPQSCELDFRASISPPSMSIFTKHGSRSASCRESSVTEFLRWSPLTYLSDSLSREASTWFNDKFRRIRSM